ncbi:SacI homology domain-containing protein [Hyaloraphidium curvatum]|nr:SacI homology domain-containing protein [Hyaloraphidium curvatum]
MAPLELFTLYETRSRFFIIASDSEQTAYRVLKVDRTTRDLHIIPDPTSYSKQEIRDLLKMIEDGNKGSGGLSKVLDMFYGLVGFLRCLEGYYIIAVTKRQPVGILGGHVIWQIDDVSLVPVPGPSAKIERSPDEQRYLQIFANLDLRRNFYFSYSYDLTNTLQRNLAGPPPEPNDMFVFNHALLRTAFEDLSSPWVLCLVHGFIDQCKIDVFGHKVFLTVIARRSRHYAGARFLKRGANDQGFVANEVETEQIVFDGMTTSFHFPPGRSGFKPSFTSFVQHRGSIPLFWSQDTSNLAPKPPIEINYRDPFYSAAALHFDMLFRRYGAPVIVLNLVKTKESVPRESLVGEEYAAGVAYLNQFLEPGRRIEYIQWDMARALKSEDENVIEVLEGIAEDVLARTGFFHSGPEPRANLLRHPENAEKRKRRRLQSGVIRTNCIDCLDRTNAAQFVIAKCALGHQLYALGIIPSPALAFDTDVVRALNSVYQDHGDAIALQYGGSQLVNTVETYRKVQRWSNQSRDMIESLRRFYSNSFTDSDKQDAINLFLGNFVPTKEGPQLWQLPTDSHLHNQDPRAECRQRSYVAWHTPAADPAPDPAPPAHSKELFERVYRPLTRSSLDRLVAYNVKGAAERAGGRAGPSPFAVGPDAAGNAWVRCGPPVRGG